MVYDDDTYDPPHHTVSGSDRVVPRDLTRIPDDHQRRIAELAASKPRWSAEQIFDRLLEEGYRIELDHVHMVLAVVRRTGR